jgi:hypothetical protein
MRMTDGYSNYDVVILTHDQVNLREDVVAAFKVLQGARSAVRTLEESRQQALRQTIWPSVVL